MSTAKVKVQTGSGSHPAEVAKARATIRQWEREAAQNRSQIENDFFGMEGGQSNERDPTNLSSLKAVSREIRRRGFLVVDGNDVRLDYECGNAQVTLYEPHLPEGGPTGATTAKCLDNWGLFVDGLERYGRGITALCQALAVVELAERWRRD